jgi:lysozyme
MSRQITSAGLALIARNEGCRLTAYQDVAGVWTICTGHTPSHQGQVCTMTQCQALLAADVGWAEAAVDGATHDVATTDPAFSAMVSFCFNVGVNAFRSSSVLRLHRLGDHTGAADDFLLWDKAHIRGQLVIVPGLLARREEERAMYLGQPEASA